MEVKYKNKSVEVWEISKTNEQPDWVKQAFKENYLSWYDDRLKILLTGINPTAKRNIKLGIMNGILIMSQILVIWGVSTLSWKKKLIFAGRGIMSSII